MRAILRALRHALHSASLLPQCTVEPTQLRFTKRTFYTDKCTIVAPIGIRADHVRVVRWLPHFVRVVPHFVRVGCSLDFELSLSNYPCADRDERRLAVESLVRHARIDAVLLCGAEGEPQRLHVALEPFQTSSVRVSIAVPCGTKQGALVEIRSIAVLGHAIQFEPLPLPLPLRVRCFAGMHAPLQLENTVGLPCGNPVIASDGTLFIVSPSASHVMMFAANGRPLPPLQQAEMGITQLHQSVFAVALHEASDTLLIAAHEDHAGIVVALNTQSRSVRWSISMPDCCMKIAVLPFYSLFVASCVLPNRLEVRRLHDGAFVSSITVNYPRCMVADFASDRVYVSTLLDDERSWIVSCFRWDVTSSALIKDDVVEAAGVEHDLRIVAVVPPSLDSTTSYLVVGTIYCSILRIISLPDRTLVHVHDLGNVALAGMTADPSGTSLAIGNYRSTNTHVVPWPLPGMQI